MKLSTLVAYKNSLDELSSKDSQQTALHELNVILHLAETQQMQLGTLTDDLKDKYNNISAAFDDFENTVNQLKQQLNDQITSAARPWFQESYRLYEEEMPHESNEYILNRRPEISQETEMFFRSRLKNYTNWTYAGMIIRPGQENFIQDLVALDPLYLVDQDRELLKPSMEGFNEQYQNRLRPYIIKENNENILEKIPNGQFGLCLVYNFFNFRPFEILKQYLEEIYQKLKPGGTLIMTFNDCDRAKAVMLVEQHFCCYTPGSMVLDLAKSIGYKPLFTWHDDGPNTWIELQRPGTLTTLKGGQALAKIIHKSVAKSK